MTKDQLFFYRNAGFGYDPKTETQRQGRARGAKALAQAEAIARERGASYLWTQDDTTSEEFSSEEPFYNLWACCMYDAHGTLIASLSGIDFGRDGSPYSDSYKRVVEAELALEALGRT